MLFWKLISMSMNQESQKDEQQDQPRPDKAPAPNEPSMTALRPEDEAIVAERLRELGYIE